MTKPAPSIRPLAFRFKPDVSALDCAFFTLDLPEAWHEPFKDLEVQRQRNRPRDKVRAPIGSLNRLLRTLLPDLISIRRSPYPKDPTWLYAREQIELAKLEALIHAWMKVRFADVAAEHLDRGLRAVRAEAAAWQIRTVDLAGWTANQHGTAQHDDPHIYTILPEYIAAALCNDAADMFYGDQPLRFRRCLLPAGQRGAELISWPPLRYSQGASDSEHLYSVTARISVQTVAFQPYPSIQVDVGLRRWAGPRQIRVPARERVSAYVLSRVSWLPSETGLSGGFQVAALERRLGTGGWHTAWADDLVAVLEELRAERLPPDAQSLLDAPHSAFYPELDESILIVHSTRLRSRHPVGAGVAPMERSRLLQDIEALLGRHFELVPEPVRAKLRSKQKLVVVQRPSQKSKQDEAGAARLRRLVKAAVGERLAVEVHAEDPQVQEALLAAIWRQFGLEPRPLPAVIETPEVTLALSLSAHPAFAEKLDLPDRIKGGVVRDALSRRVSLVKEALAPAGWPTLALKQIGAKITDYSLHDDPKIGLRIGYGQRGRVVQFINPDPAVRAAGEDAPDEKQTSLAHRASSSLRDGLRQLGVGPAIDRLPGALQRLNLIGFWLINKNSGKQDREQYVLPVLVWLSPSNHQIHACAPGFDKWLPYREALLALAQGKANGVKSINQVSMDFVRTRLRDDILGDQPTLLTCSAQNIRKVWPWLNNTQLQADQPVFVRGRIESAADFPGLRIVRVRAGEETPQWYADNGRGPTAATGLFQLPDNPRVFASLHGKPKQLKDYSHYLSKIDWSISDETKFRPKTDTHTWNPGFYELTVAMLQPEDGGDAAPWADAVHRLRQGAVQYDDATALPLPLHLAKLMEEYILSVDIAEEDA